MKGAVLALCAVFLFGYAHAGEIEDLKMQIDAIRKGAIQSSASVAEAMSAIQQIQSDIEALKAAVEKNERLIQDQAKQLNLKVGDIEARISALEEKLAVQTAQITSAVATVSPSVAAEAEMYQMGLNQVSNSKFLEAIATLQKFLQKYPKSAYRENAQYWIAECYFAMREYERAIKEFQSFKEQFPKSEKMPKVLLKQAYAFVALGMDSDAKVFFDDLIKKYPGSKEAAEAKARLENTNKDQPKAPQAGKDEVPLAPGVQLQQRK
jgi:tol-pal system protein YbgF